MERIPKAKAVLAAVLGVILITLILQNTTSVEVKLLFWSVTGPLVILGLATGFLGFALGVFFGREIFTRPKSGSR